MGNMNKGDEFYDESDEYEFADEVGWIEKSTGKVVERHEGYGGRKQRESDAEFYREERLRERFR